MEFSDVLIIGAGPAGTTLGCILAQKGVSVTVVDKCVFPRQKLCAGGVTFAAAQAYERIIGKEYFSYADTAVKAKLYFWDRFIMEIDLENPLRFVDRQTFDFELLNRFTALGGKAMTGVKPLSFDTENKTVTLADGGQISYRVLVGADGANSAVRKLIDPDYRPNAFCVETFVENSTDMHTVNIYAGEGGGYGWIFPHGKTLAVGYGGSVHRAKYNRDNFASFVKMTGEQSENYTLKGAFIPTKPVFSPAKGSIFLIGDAGGFVFPTTGEGLYYAAYSAEKASESIIDLLNCVITEDQSEEDYRGRLTEIYRVSQEAEKAMGKFSGKKARRKFLSFCQNSKLIRSLVFAYCRKRPDMVAYFFEQVTSGKSFDPVKIRKDYLKIRKTRKKAR